MEVTTPVRTELPVLEDAVSLLKREHRLIEQHLMRCLKEDAVPLWDGIINETLIYIKVHMEIEEEIFYPAVKALRNKDAKFEVEEALHEHKQIKAAVAEISKMEPDDEPALGATMKVLKEDVEHHADEEEKEMFKEARKMGDSRLEELGDKLQSRKDQLKAIVSGRKA